MTSGRPVCYFVYDEANQRVTLVPLDDVEPITEYSPTDYYYDGGPPKPYWKIDVSEFEWEALTEEMLAA